MDKSEVAEKMLNECGWILTCKCGTNASASGSHLLAPPVMTSCVMLQVVYLYICDYALAFWCICIMWHHHTALWIDANWLQHRSFAVVSADLSQCFDFIGHPQCSLAFQAFGCPINPIKINANDTANYELLAKERLW